MNEVKLGVPIKCARCGHEWLPRVLRIRSCPKCRSLYWDTPRKKDVVVDIPKLIKKPLLKKRKLLLKKRSVK